MAGSAENNGRPHKFLYYQSLFQALFSNGILILLRLFNSILHAYISVNNVQCNLSDSMLFVQATVAL